MVKRSFWLQRINSAWLERSIIWLTGVRRVGKTTLANSIEGVSYFDCELPRVRRVIEEDPEGFLGGGFSGPLVLDKVHRFANPSEILKIAD